MDVRPFSSGPHRTLGSHLCGFIVLRAANELSRPVELQAAGVACPPVSREQTWRSRSESESGLSGAESLAEQ